MNETKWDVGERLGRAGIRHRAVERRPPPRKVPFDVHEGPSRSLERVQSPSPASHGTKRLKRAQTRLGSRRRPTRGPTRVRDLTDARLHGSPALAILVARQLRPSQGSRPASAPLKASLGSPRTYDPRMRAAFAASLVLGLMIVPSSATADPRFHGGRVYVRGPGCDSETYRASTIIFFCADAGVIVTNIRYRSYGGSVATGTALQHANDCNPFCARGTISTARVTIRLSNVVRCEGTLFYSRAVTRYIGPPPVGEPSAMTVNIRPFYETECSSVLG
jgi:hypothetical protein